MYFYAAYASTAVYVAAMKILLMILAALAMLATLGVLFAGLIGMARGNDPMRSNMFMRWRVLLQAAAIAIVALLMLLARG